MAVTTTSAGSSLARGQPDAVLLEAVDLAGHDRGAAGLDRLEEVAVGHQAQPLVPRVVGRLEVVVGAVVLAELLAQLAGEVGRDLVRLAARLLEEQVVQGMFFCRVIQ